VTAALALSGVVAVPTHAQDFLAPVVGQALSDVKAIAAHAMVESVDEQSQTNAGMEENGDIEDGGMIVDTASDALTLQTLESMAMASNPSIGRAAALVNAARGRALQVGLPPNPEVGLDFEQLGSDGRAEQYGVAFRQEIVRRQKLRLNRSIALHEAHRLQQELAAQRQRVLTDVRVAYIRALRAERQIDLTKRLVEIGQQGVKVAEELLIAQEVGRGDVLQAELEVESAIILLRNAENRRIAVWQELSSLTGQGLLEPQPLVGDITAMESERQFDEVILQLRNQSPEVAAVMAAIERARCNLARQQFEPRPNVLIEGLINWRDNGTGGDANGAIVVALPIPIWNKNQGGIREARHQLVAVHQELGQVELDLQNRLAPVYERYRNARAQVDRYQDRILPKAAETLELTRQTYELGEVSFINLLTVQRTYARNQLAYLDALESLRVAEAEISGLLLSGSLSQR
jgi:cobalt-zinc-cadmium efflux system outer membrane protein